VQAAYHLRHALRLPRSKALGDHFRLSQQQARPVVVLPEC